MLRTSEPPCWSASMAGDAGMLCTRSSSGAGLGGRHGGAGVVVFGSEAGCARCVEASATTAACGGRGCGGAPRRFCSRSRVVAATLDFGRARWGAAALTTQLLLQVLSLPLPPYLCSSLFCCIHFVLVIREAEHHGRAGELLHSAATAS